MTNPTEHLLVTAASSPRAGRSALPYVRWMEAQGVPVYAGHYVEDLRTLPLGRWRERECDAAFLHFAGQEGISEARVSEIAPGQTLPPLKFTLDEVVYVIEGRGLTTVWAAEGAPPATFEWDKRSMFLLPRGSTHQFTNVQGDRPARLLQRNFLPLAMSLIPDPRFFFNLPALASDALARDNASFYSEAKMIRTSDDSGRRPPAEWHGNFFPDMLAWDRLTPYRRRGAGGHSVAIVFSGSELSARMSVFPVGTYKKAHRHGPGRVIVIPGGEGYSVMWEEGGERVIVPWHEGSVFSPPDRWFHQHFNVGSVPARYLRPISSGALPQFAGHSERIEDRDRDQIEYVDEDPWIREHFEAELAKRGLKSLMPPECYQDPNYEWQYGEDE
jgi:oxalate decarboxylase/phosphoglucose isomerase-like protein (cupin superfamily)